MTATASCTWKTCKDIIEKIRFFYFSLKPFYYRIVSDERGDGWCGGESEAGKSVRIKYDYIHIKPIQTFSS